MRSYEYILQILPLLLLWNLAALPRTQSSVLLPNNLRAIQPNPFSPFQAPVDLPEAQDDKRPWARFRDRLIRFVWNIPIEDQSRTANLQSSWETSNPPSSLKARYGDDVVLRFQIQSLEESTALSEAIYVLMLDVWEFNADWVDIRLSKDVVPSLLGLLPESLQRAHIPLIHDLTQAIFESYPSATFEEPTPLAQDGYRTFSPDLRPPTDETNIFFRNYQPLSVIVPWMRLLSSLFPTHVRMLNIGVSYEGRDILALRVGVHPTNSEKPSAPRKTIIITGGSHAREWISTSSVNYVAYSFITAYGKSPPMTKLLEKFDWIFIPTLNPDGYVYTWESDRLWRKNRQQTGIRFCKGVDLDRTFGFEWDGDSPKNNPCSESFAGEAPFQGVESHRFANWIRNETEQNHAEIVAFLDFHSYSQQVLYPYSYSCTSTPPLLENLEELAIGIAKAIRLTNGHSYGVTSACEGSVLVENDEKKTSTVDGNAKNSQRDKHELWPRMESGGGSALDWFYHEIHVRYVYQIKLRDTGSYGFLLPSRNIVPTGKEAFSAVKYLGEFLLRNKIVGEVAMEDDSAAESENGAGGAMKNEQAAGREQQSLRGNSATEVFETADEAVQNQNAEEEEEEEKEEGTAEINWELRRRRK